MLSCSIVVFDISLCNAFSQENNDQFSADEFVSENDKFLDSHQDPVLQELKAYANIYKGKTQNISLDYVIREVITSNPKVVKSYRSIQGQEWDVIAQRRQWWPTLQLEGKPLYGSNFTTNVTSYTNPGKYTESTLGISGSSSSSSTSTSTNNSSNPQNTNTSDSTSSSESDSFQTTKGSYLTAMQLYPMAVVQWDIIKPSRGSEINASLEKLNKQNFLLDIIARDLILEAQQAYFELQSTSVLINQYILIANATEQALEELNGLYSKRLVSLNDVSALEAQYYNNMTQLIEFYKQHITASAKLSALMGLSEVSLFIPTEGLKTTGSWDLSLEDSIKSGIEFREEIKSKIAEAKAYEWDAVALMQSYYPTVGFYGIGFIQSNSGVINNPLSGDPASNWDGTSMLALAQLGIGFTWNFDGLIKAANSNQKKYMSKQLVAASEEMKLDVIKEVRTAFDKYHTSKVKIASAKRATTSANTNLNVVRARSQIGLADTTTNVQSIQLLAQANVNYANAIKDYNDAIAQLYRYVAKWPGDTYETLQNIKEKLR